MKRALAAAVFLVAALNCAHAQPVVTLRPSAVLNELKLFSSMYPRTEGSAGERAAIGNITSSLDRLGVRYTQQSFEDIEGTHSYSSSIDVSIRGKKPDELLFIVPIDQPLNASKANDGSINLALALGMIESLSRTVPPISLRFLFLGGEFGAGPAYPIGTKQFLDNFYPDFPVIALYLDFRSVPNRTNITSGGIRIVAPYWLINRCSSAMDQAGLYYLVRGNENQIFRLGLVSSPPAINPYLQQGYPALELSGIEGSLPADRYTDWVSSFEQFFNNFLEANSSGFPTAWDKHYLFFQIRSFSFIVPERAYVLIVIVLLGLVLAYPIIYRERFLRYLTTIGRNVLSIPLLLAVAFVFLLLGTLLVEGIFVVRNFPTMWRQAPFLFFSCKVAAALFLFALLYRFLKVLPFSRNGRFYGAAAILLLLVDSIVLGLFDFSLAYYFVWALMWSVLFSMVRSRALKIVILAISTAWLLKAIVDVFTLPALDVIRIMILSRISGNAIIAIVILPFLFMIIRVDMMFRHPRRKQALTIVRAIDTILGAATAALVVVLVRLAPYNEAHPQPVFVQETIAPGALSRTVELSSPAPLGKISIRTEGLTRAVSTGSRRFRFRLPGAESYLESSVNTSTFLDRRQVDLNLTPVGRPSQVTVTLSSSKEIVIFDSNFPFSYRPGSNTAEIHIGRNPPFPLDVQFTLPQNIAVELRITLDYTVLPTPLVVSGTNISVESSLVVTKELSIGAS